MSPPVSTFSRCPPLFLLNWEVVNSGAWSLMSVIVTAISQVLLRPEAGEGMLGRPEWEQRGQGTLVTFRALTALCSSQVSDQHLKQDVLASLEGGSPQCHTARGGIQLESSPLCPLLGLRAQQPIHNVGIGGTGGICILYQKLSHLGTCKDSTHMDGTTARPRGLTSPTLLCVCVCVRVCVCVCWGET